ncbi:hypothetical protein [uncultured Treponema sp.]|uniref:hypothetical protein n=1 Tax=uncultured Treponema sp. TaxID=162155 RepID=UPI0026237574|nr:hypothetical protein [uncultured Treponema sp.]
MRLKSLSLNTGYDAAVKWRMTDICNYSCSYCSRAKTLKEYDAGKINAENEELKSVAQKINALLEKSGFKNIKIDLVGGEVTLLDLPLILDAISTEKVKEYNITTNFSQSAEYYIQLAKKIPLSMTASLHEQHTDLNVFFEKARAVKEAGVLKDFKCETVSCTGNQDIIKIFEEKCGENGLEYIIDRDKNNIEKTQNISSRREKNLYIAEFTDGTKKEFPSKAALLETFIDTRLCEGRRINTKGLICTFSYNFIYIDKDTVLGRAKENSGCKNRIPIDKFEILPPAKCQIDYCSLCGFFSLYAPEDEELEEHSEILAIDETETDDEDEEDVEECASENQ